MSISPGVILSGPARLVPVDLKVHYGKGNSKTFLMNRNELTLKKVEEAVRDSISVPIAALKFCIGNQSTLLTHESQLRDATANPIPIYVVNVQIGFSKVKTVEAA